MYNFNQRGLNSNFQWMIIFEYNINLTQNSRPNDELCMRLQHNISCKSQTRVACMSSNAIPFFSFIIFFVFFLFCILDSCRISIQPKMLQNNFNVKICGCFSLAFVVLAIAHGGRFSGKLYVYSLANANAQFKAIHLSLIFTSISAARLNL